MEQDVMFAVQNATAERHGMSSIAAKAAG